MQFQALHIALFESTLLIPCVPKWGGGGNPMRIGPATPNNALSLATLNVRRLWLQDESVHGGFHMFCAILNSENVAVCCIQARLVRSQETSVSTMTGLLSLAAAKQHFCITVESRAFPFLVSKTLSRCGGAISRA